jgi:hypothetical protein
LRKFQKDVCSAYKTYELPSEEAARVRRRASAAKKKAHQSQQKETPLVKNARRQRMFSLNTYKTHSLGSYPSAIRLFGSTDNYNSQTVFFFAVRYFFAS